MRSSNFPRRLLGATLVALCALGTASAGATELISNGGFEADGAFTYSPSGWTVAESFGIGGVAVDSATSSHASGWAAAGPASGSYYASLDAFSLGAYTLSQSFSTAAVRQATLSFQMYVNDQSASGSARVGGTLDYTSSSPLYYARVDVLKAGADSFASGTDVVKSLYIGGATGRLYGNSSNGYVGFTYDLSDVLAKGGQYTLRFAVINNQGDQMQMGLDNVSLQVAAVPEPESYALMLAGLGLVGVVARRRRSAK